jgi:hypothetical protein
MNHTPSSPLVSTIIVSYNTKVWTCQAVCSVYTSHGFKPGELEVIVVDNGSHDGTVAALRKLTKAPQVIESSQNLGFGGGNNLGACHAQGKYLLLLNSDAFLEPATLRRLVDELEQNETLLTVAPRLTYESGALQPSAGYLPTPLRVATWILGKDVLVNKIPLLKTRVKMYHQRAGVWYEHNQTPEWLMGACILMRRSEFEAVGGFDDQMFMYAEEVELYLRLKKHFPTRILARYLANTTIIHIGGGSAGVDKARRLIQEFTGIIYLYQKHYPSLLWYIRGIIKLGVSLRVWAFTFLPGREADRRAYQKYLEQT